MKRQKTDLSSLTEEQLLKTRLCDLGLQIKGTWLEECIDDLYKELDGKGIKFHPACYLADEWLAPENEPVIGIAFFLAHPGLKSLEYKMMQEVEGGDKASCMKLLRHEAGHAINYAYQLYKRKKWRTVFGHFTREYPDRYKYRPYSRSFVVHLEEWYAQYHPDEDFSETFAVWLDPGSNWKEKYKGWKAMEKLEYVNDLMTEVSKTAPKKKTGIKFWNISKIKMTLRTYYKRKTEFYAEYSPSFHDHHLNKIFPKDVQGSKRKAYKIISKYKKSILKHVSFWTGERKYIINQLLKNLIKRCRELKLETTSEDIYPLLQITSYVTALIMNYIYTGRLKREK
ncbi:MAG: hypothetical protein JW871_00620 [Endomicrobiales bacterium]|nr:hypothetical protein [Endomicrobiales bacterium]